MLPFFFAPLVLEFSSLRTFHARGSRFSLLQQIVILGQLSSDWCSNYDIFLTRDCLAYAKIKPAVNQIETHPYFQRDSLVKFYQKHGICVTAHTPLGGSTANAEWFGTVSCLDDPVIKVVAISNLSIVSSGANAVC